MEGFAESLAIPRIPFEPLDHSRHIAIAHLNRIDQRVENSHFELISPSIPEAGLARLHVEQTGRVAGARAMAETDRYRAAIAEGVGGDVAARTPDRTIGAEPWIEEQPLPQRSSHRCVVG